jgi:hypothetical protein
MHTYHSSAVPAVAAKVEIGRSREVYDVDRTSTFIVGKDLVFLGKYHLSAASVFAVKSIDRQHSPNIRCRSDNCVRVRVDDGTSLQFDLTTQSVSEASPPSESSRWRYHSHSLQMVVNYNQKRQPLRSGVNYIRPHGEIIEVIGRD